MGDSIEHYHHEFTRLTNGHYMVLAQNFKYWKSPIVGDSDLVFSSKEKIKPEDMDKYARIPMGTLIEYDEKGKIVWSWKSSDYFNGSNIFYRRTADGGAMQMTAHENSFFFDEKSKTIYLSCRNLNRVIKVEYPEGNVLAIYGNDNSIPGHPTGTDSVLFCGQHSCRVSKKGYLYLYNNNTCVLGAMPTIVEMKEPTTEKQSLKKIWEYTCSFEAQNPKRDIKGFPSGGNVLELPDGSFFVSMAYPGSRVFIVNLKKEILWSAVAEKHSPDGKKWESQNLFRASIVSSRKQLEQLIWNAEKS